MDHLTECCRDNDLALNTSKTKEMIIDFKGSGVRKQNLPLHIHGEIVETVESLKYLGVTLTVQLTWSTNISQLVKKAQQRLFILRKLKQAKPLQKVCRSAVKSILTNSNSVVCQLCCCREEWWEHQRALLGRSSHIWTPSLPSVWRRQTVSARTVHPDQSRTVLNNQDRNRNSFYSKMTTSTTLHTLL